VKAPNELEFVDNSESALTLQDKSSILMKAQSSSTYELGSTFVKRVSILSDRLLSQTPDLHDEVVIM